MNKQESIGLAVIAGIIFVLWWLSQNALGFLHGSVIGQAGAGIAGASVTSSAQQVSSGCCS